MPTLLICEDDDHQRLLYEEELRDEGYDIVVAHSGHEALEMAQRVAPDLVILDIAMPGMDGIETLGQLLSKNNQLPVILHTAYATYKDNFMSWSADAYVIKAADLTELKAEIRRVLAKRTTESEGESERDA